MKRDSREVGSEALDAGVASPGFPCIVKIRLAWEGARLAWLEEVSFRRQTYGAVTMLVLLGMLRPAPTWWAVCLLATLMVLALELLNSALERLTDHLHPSQHDAVKAVKDMAGGAVVVGNLGMMVVGLGVIFTSFGMIGG